MSIQSGVADATFRPGVRGVQWGNDGHFRVTDARKLTLGQRVFPPLHYRNEDQ